MAHENPDNCAFCSHPPELLDDGMEGTDRRWRVTCPACRQSSPELPTAEAAIELWNSAQDFWNR